MHQFFLMSTVVAALAHTCVTQCLQENTPGGEPTVKPTTLGLFVLKEELNPKPANRSM